LDLFDLFAKISIDLSDFDRGLDEASKKFRSFSDNIKGISDNFGKAGSGVKDLLSPAVDGFKAVEGVGKKAGDVVSTGFKGFAAAAAAVGGFGTAAVKSGMQFDAAMSEVSAISGATGEDFAALRDKALEMGARTKFSASEAAAAMTYMGMAGWKAGDMISGIEGIMNLAAASGEDLATTSDIVTDALTAFGLQAGDSGHFANVMAVAASNANTNVGMMGETFKYVAPVAGALGYSVDDTALAIGLMANSGIKATQAGTALRSIFTRLSTDAGASSKSLGALGTLTEKLGVEFYNADGSARNLNDVLVDSRSAWAGLSEEQQITYAKTIAGQEAMSGWLALMNAAPADVEKLTAALADCNGAAKEMASTMIDNLQGDLTLLGSAFESLQIAISDSLTPTLREFAQFGSQAMANLLEGFQGGGVGGFTSALSGIVTDGVTMLAGKAPEFAGVSLQFVAAFATGILDAGREISNAVGEIVSTFITGFDEWLGTNAASLAELGLTLVNTIFEGFTQSGEVLSAHIGTFLPLIAEAFLSYHESLFTVGMDILGAIGQGMIDNKEGIQEMASNTITSMVTALRDNAPAIIEGGIALLEALAGAIVENLPLILETGVQIIGELVAGITTSLPALAAAAAAIIPYICTVIDVVNSVGQAVGGVVQLVSGGIGTILGIGKTLMTGIQGLFSLILAHPVVAVVTAIIAAVVLLWQNCEAFRDAVGAIWDAIVGFFQTAADRIKGAFDGVVEFFTGVWEGIQSAFSGVVEFFSGLFASAWAAIQSAWSAAVEFFSGIWEGIQGVFAAAAEVLGGFFQAAWEAVQTAWNAAVEFFTGVADGIHSVFEAVTEFLSSTFQEAYEAVKSVWEAAKEFFQGIWNAIQEAAGEAGQFIGSALKEAWEAVQSAWDKAGEFFRGVLDKIVGIFQNIGGKFKEIGGNIVNGLKSGVLGAWGAFTSFMSEKINGIISGVKGLLGIHSPSAVFSGIGENMALGLAGGWEEQYRSIKHQIESGMDFGIAKVGLEAGGAIAGRNSGASYGEAGPFPAAQNLTVNIYSPEKTDAVQAAREWKKTAQKMALGFV